MRNFSNWIDAFLEYTQYAEVPESFLKWSALAVVSGALERKVWINFKNIKSCYPNMYVMLVGPPGLAKKSTSSSLAVDLLKQVDGINFMSNQVTSARLIEEIHTAGTAKLEGVEFGGERYIMSSLYIYASEAATTLKEVQGSIIELLTDFYDCGPDGWNSGNNFWSKATKGDGRTKVYNPSLGMLACSTPVWLVKSIGKEDLESGFASRIIFVVSNNACKKSYGWDMPSTKDMVPKLVQDLAHINKLKGEFRVTPCFIDAFNTFDDKQKLWLEANTKDSLIGYHARKGWHLMKLSQILSVSESDKLEVTGEHFVRAQKLLAEVEPSMYDAFGELETSHESRMLKAIWEKLRKHNKDQIVAAELLSKFYAVDYSMLKNIIAKLVQMNKLEVIRYEGNLVYKILNREALG